MSKVSPLVDGLVEAFQCLPGVGPKSAQRMVLHLLERNKNGGLILSLHHDLRLPQNPQAHGAREVRRERLAAPHDRGGGVGAGAPHTPVARRERKT